LVQLVLISLSLIVSVTYLRLCILIHHLTTHKYRDVVLLLRLKDVICHSYDLDGAYLEACLLEGFSRCTLEEAFAVV
jgi:hypothetical protein